MTNKVIEKPWGYEELLEHNERYVLKKLFMKKGCRCSLQYHLVKCETILVLQGKLDIEEGASVDSLKRVTYGEGESLTLKPGRIHRMSAQEDCLYIEASTPELDDVERISDDYNRV